MCGEVPLAGRLFFFRRRARHDSIQSKMQAKLISHWHKTRMELNHARASPALAVVASFLSYPRQIRAVLSVLMDMRRGNRALIQRTVITMKHCIVCYSPSRRELGDICPECNWEEDMVETKNTSWVSDGQRFSMTVGYSSCNGWTWMEFQQWYVNALRGSRLRMFWARCRRLGYEVVRRTSDEDQRFF